MKFQAEAVEQVHDEKCSNDSELVFGKHKHAIAHPDDQVLADSFDVLANFDLSFALGTEPGISGKTIAAKQKCGGYFKRDESQEYFKHDERYELN